MFVRPPGNSLLWLLIPLVAWSLLVSISLDRELEHRFDDITDFATERTRNLFQIVELTRLWNAQHGGVYVPVTDATQPNPYLKVPDRDLVAADGMKLTMINPAYMTRQISELARDLGVVFHITGLKPLNPDNRADPWERRALQAFEQGTAELAELIQGDDANSFRYMAPLRIKDACLSCHGAQGYRTGDVKGGISVTLPATEMVGRIARTRYEIIAGHLFVWLVISLLIIGYLYKHRRHVRQLEEIRQGQEVQIEQRTAELVQSNEQLSHINAESRRALVALEESEQQLHEITTTLGEGLYVIDIEGLITFTNPAAVEMLGWSSEELLGRNAHALFHRDRELVAGSVEEKCPVLEAMANAASLKNYETLFWTRAGDGFPVKLLSTPIIRNGQVEGTVVAFHDITDLKEEQKAIRQYAKRVKLAARAGGIAVWEWEVGSGRLIWDDHMFELYQMDPESFSGSYSDWLALMHPDDRPAAEQALNATMESGGEFTSEFRICLPDGELRSIKAAGLLEYDLGGRPLRMIGINYDISRHKEYEMLLEGAREAAVNANRAKGLFLANVSHEIRTPMNAILGLTHITLGTELTEKQRDNLEKVLRSARSLLRIISDILEFSKMEAGKLELRSEPFQLSELFAELAVLHDVDAHEKRIRLSFLQEEDIPNRLYGDGLRLSQILSNLIGNAIKFTQEGSVKCRARLVQRSDDTAVISFSVEDTGIGMSDEEMAGLFQPFAQVDSTASRRHGGTGLGLSISKRLVEVMAGEISLSSTPGEGSSFIVQLPLGIGSLDEEITNGTVLEQLKNLRVLVVNADSRERRQLCSCLGHLQLRYKAVVDRSHAIQALGDNSGESEFGLVIVAQVLPNRQELLNDLKQKSQQPLPRMITLPFDMPYDIPSEAKNHQIDNLLTLPTTVSQLHEALLTVLGESSATRIMAPEVKGRALQSIRGAEVLVVEDNKMNQIVATELLQSMGLEVTCVADGRDAIEQLEQHLYDLVLMDIQMAGIDGYETTRRIRTTIPKNQLPIVAMTAHALASDREKSLAAGMNDHLNKPIEPRLLEDMLLRWIPPRIAVLEESDYAEPGSVEINSMLPASLPGIDIAVGVRRLGSDTLRFKRTLERFLDEFGERPEGVRQMQQDEAWNDLRNLAHTLKSAAGIIGAEGLSRSAADLEQALNDGDSSEYHNLLQGFEDNLRQVISTLNQAFVEHVFDKAAPSQGEAGRQQLDLMTELDELLRIGDTEALELGNQLTLQLAGEVPGELIERLHGQLQGFDLSSARNTLESIRSAYPASQDESL
ncbi:MAG: ATP-binding protein [Candidatus Sedimenticola sp. (ex Thyasira tokunagai)]